MDIAHELSYDHTVPYEDQVTTPQGASLANRIGTTKVYLLSDTSRLGKVRHPLFVPGPDSSLRSFIVGKRKIANTVDNAEAANSDAQSRGEAEAEDDGDDDDDEMDIDQDPTLRSNAILLQGPPVAHLPTGRIFDYTGHFDVHPLGLEWIDDTTCIFVFSSKQAARSAYLALQKPTAPSESTSVADLTTARPIPIELWPPEDRIHHSLGVGQGLRGTLHMRWARLDDKKKRGAKKDSAFYRKHGLDAGKESAGFGVVPASAAVAAAAADAVGASGGQDSLAMRLSKVGDTLEETIAMEDEEQVEVEGVREWDRGKPGLNVLEASGSVGGKRKRGRRNDAEEFLSDDLEDDDRGDHGHAPESPPSKMRSDYIAKDGRTVIGSINGNGPGLAERILARLPRRARSSPHQRGRRGEQGNEESDQDWVSTRVDGEGRGRQSGRRRGRNKGSVIEPPRKKTREELDEELEAFLNDRA